MNIEDIINKIRKCNFNPLATIICVNATTYKKIREEEEQKTNIDYYNGNFANMQLVIDNSLEDDEVEIR